VFVVVVVIVFSGPRKTFDDDNDSRFAAASRTTTTIETETPGYDPDIPRGSNEAGCGKADEIAFHDISAERVNLNMSRSVSQKSTVDPSPGLETNAALRKTFCPLRNCIPDHWPLQSGRFRYAIRIVLLTVLCLWPAPCFAGTDGLKLIVPGRYILIGKALDSEATFTGKVVIQESGDGFMVNRKVDGRDIVGRGAIETALNGDAEVLRIRFRDNGLDYEETCMVGSDLDNYARISCYLYRPGTHTTNPGLEVLFHDHTAR